MLQINGKRMNTSAGFLTLILTVVTEVLLAQSSIVQVSKAQLPVKIDGELNESIWKTSAPISLAFETDPANNKPATVQTTCYIAYDEENLYLACMPPPTPMPRSAGRRRPEKAALARK